MSTRVIARIARALFIPMILTLAGCGGGGGGGPAADIAAPSVFATTPVFPNGQISTATVLVTGQVTDNGTVVSVTVNGVAATSTDGFLTWSVTIPLNMGGNVLMAEATDAAGNTGGQIWQVTRVSDTMFPMAEIVFPPAPAMTTGATVTVVGTADDDFPIVSLTVNGVAATTTDAYAHWTATVPLNPGSNNLSVTVSDVSGNTSGGADSVAVTRSGVWAQRPTSISYDAAGDRMLVTDNSHDGVLAISSADVLSVLSSPGLGTGTVLSLPNSVTSIGTNGFVGSNLESTIAKVDLTNGNRTALSGGGAGSGTAFVALFGLGADASRNVVLALDFHQQSLPQSNRLFTVDPSTGARTLLTGGTAGSGATFGLVSALVHDTVNDRYITAGIDNSNGIAQVLAVDPVSGARTELSGGTVGSGASLSGARDVVLLSSTVALVMTAPNSSNSRNLDDLFVSVDLTTGVRTLVTHTGVVAQPTFASGVLAMDIDPDTGDVYLTDSSGGAVWRIAFNSVTDIASITLVEPATASIGSGPKLVFNSGLAIDLVGDRLFTAERRPDQITAIDLDTGTRSVASSSTVGTGAGPLAPRRVEFDSPGDRAFLVDGTGGVSLMEFEPSTGDRTTIVSDGATLPLSATIMASALDLGRNRILLGGSGDSTVRTVDLTSGAISALTTLNAISATSSRVTGIGFDSTTDRYLVSDEDGKIFRVVAATGATTLLADALAAGLDQPGSIVVRSASIAYVNDHLDGELYRVNPNTGVVTRVFGPTSPGTKGAGNDGSLAWYSPTGLLYWTDNGTHSISVFEPVSGDRVIISR